MLNGGVKMEVDEDIQYMIDMTQEAFTACLECHNAPVGEHRERELRRFAEEHPDIVEHQKELVRGYGQGPKGIPDWRLIEPAICFIGMVCCSCCEDNHKDIWDMCQQAREDYERENAEMRAKGVYL